MHSDAQNLLELIFTARWQHNYLADNGDIFGDFLTSIEITINNQLVY